MPGTKRTEQLKKSLEYKPPHSLLLDSRTDLRKANSPLAFPAWTVRDSHPQREIKNGKGGQKLAG